MWLCGCPVESRVVAMSVLLKLPSPCCIEHIWTGDGGMDALANVQESQKAWLSGFELIITFVLVSSASHTAAQCDGPAVVLGGLSLQR